jgi:hypothetical protein
MGVQSSPQRGKLRSPRTNYEMGNSSRERRVAAKCLTHRIIKF